MDLGSAIRLAKQQNNMLYLDEILERAKGMLERDTMTATEALEGYTCYLRDVVKQYEQNK